MIVVDASVIVELLLQTAVAERVERRLFQPHETLHAPALLDVEAAQVLRRYVSRGDLSATRGHVAITLLGKMPITRHTHTVLLPRIWALRENVTAYDAAYIALAEALGTVFVTRDASLAKTRGHRATCELI